MTKFPIERWFAKFGQDLESTPPGPEDAWPTTPLRMLVEALSDASAEQFLNPLVAMHLRRFGSAWARRAGDAGKVFWVRGEWEKVDLSYGLAAPFNHEDWDRAWCDGATGDLGQIETKVCYTHLTPPIGTLVDQIVERRDRDRKLHKQWKRATAQQFHALVALFGHSGTAGLDDLEEKARSYRQLSQVGEFTRFSEPQNLGRLWPTRSAKNYQCRVSLGLFRLA